MKKHGIRGHKKFWKGLKQKIKKGKHFGSLFKKIKSHSKTGKKSHSKNKHNSERKKHQRSNQQNDMENNSDGEENDNKAKDKSNHLVKKHTKKENGF